MNENLHSKSMKYFSLLFLILLFSCNNFSFTQDKNLAEIYSKYYQWYPCKEATGKWAFWSVDGQQLNKAFFDTITEFNDRGVAGVDLNGKRGVIDKEGKFVVPVIYDKVEINRDAQIILVSSTAKDGKKTMGAYDLKGKLIVPVKYAFCTPSGENAFDYRHMQGKKTIVCHYESNSNRGSRQEVFSLTGKLLLDTSAFNKPVDEEWFYFVNNERMVGSVHIPYDRSMPHYESNLLRSKLSQYFVKESSIPAENSVFILPTDAGEMLLNVQGDTIVKPQKDQQFLLGGAYGKIQENASQLIGFREKWKWGLMEKNGRMLVEPRFDAPIEYNQNGGTGYTDGKTVLFDTLWQEMNFEKHQKVSRLESYDNPKKWPKEDWRQDHFLIKENGKYGIITRQGKTIVPAIWDEIELMYAGKQRAMLNMKQKSGKMVVVVYDANKKVLEEKYFDAEWLSGHLCLIQKEKTSDILNVETGEYIRKDIVNNTLEPTEKKNFIYRPMQADYDLEPNNLIAVYVKDKGWELIDSTGKVVIPAKHPDCKYARPIVRADTVWGVVYFDYNTITPRSSIESRGKTIIPFTNGELEYEPHENRIRRYVHHRSPYENDSNRDSIDIYSMDGTWLKIVQRNQFAFVPATENFKEPFYLYKEAAGFNFYDLNFKPLFPQYFESIIGNQYAKYFTGRIKGKNYVIYSADGLVCSRPYDEILFCKSGFIGKYGKLEDLYSQNGTLMFAGCENLRQFDTYLTFQKDGKTCNANMAGEIYRIK